MPDDQNGNELSVFVKLVLGSLFDRRGAYARACRLSERANFLPVHGSYVTASPLSFYPLLASHARQADDDSLRKLADRIQARAVRRCGELLKTFNSQGKRNDQPSVAAVEKSQRQAAWEAGLSERQELTAVRIASIPQDQFDAAVESDDPPTVTKLAEMRRQSALGLTCNFL